MSADIEKTLEERLELQVARERESFAFELEVEYDIVDRIRFGWQSVDMPDRGWFYVAQSDLRISISPRIHLKQVEDWTYNEDRSSGDQSNPADPIVHETNSPTEYITVHYQNGNYEWFEFNFRVRDGTAYLGSKTRLRRPNNGRGWIPPVVKESIQDHHPELEVSSDLPPWWE